MMLSEVVDRLHELDETNDRLTIYAVEPWRPQSEAVVVNLPEDGTITPVKAASGADATYFLEVFIARDFLHAYREGGFSSSLEEDCERLIRYALYDA